MAAHGSPWGAPSLEEQMIPEGKGIIIFTMEVTPKSSRERCNSLVTSTSANAQ